MLICDAGLGRQMERDPLPGPGTGCPNTTQTHHGREWDSCSGPLSPAIWERGPRKQAEKEERPSLVARVRTGRESRSPSQLQCARVLMGSLSHGGADAQGGITLALWG